MKRSCTPPGLLICGLVLLFSCDPAPAGEGAYVKRDGKEPAIGNSFLELAFRAGDGKCSATRLVNKLSGRKVAITADDFAIGIEGRQPLRAADFRFVAIKKAVAPGRAELTLQYENKSLGLKLDIVYEAPDSSPVLRRRLELTTARPLGLRKVEVWRAKVGGKCSHQGYGEPVFLEDTFWGVEFPGAENRYTEGEVRLAHHPGRTVRGRFVSKPAVLGVAKGGQVARRFRRYVERFQATSQDKFRLFINYNTWWTLMPPTEANCLALIDVFKKNLFDPHGESFDTFTIDDGWDDKATLWAIRSDRFGKGFSPLIKPLASMKGNLGLWLSPSSGYGHAPHLAKQGYEHNSNKRYCCQSGPKYRRDIVKVVTGLAKKYDMAFFKFDGFQSTCEATGHGHLGGLYAREANIDAFIELMQAVRKARPGVYIDPTCGMWLSPWWLKYCDSIWGSVSGDYPNVIVPAPVLRDSATTTRDAVFRQRCREHPGFPPAAIEHLGIIVITPEKWEDNAMAVAGRGARLLTLYINPKFFKKPKSDWAFLASVLKWVRHNAGVLRQTELILGDPLKREVYGFAHFSGQRGILSLRNPFIEPKKVEVKLDESLGWLQGDAHGSGAGTGRFVARVVYPRHELLHASFKYGDTLELSLQAYETLIVQIEPVIPGQPRLLGLRSQETRRAGKQVKYAVYARAGDGTVPVVTGVAGSARAFLNGRGVLPATPPLPHGTQFHLRFPGRGEACAVRAAQLEPAAQEAGWKLVGRCKAHVPAKSKATMYLLCDPGAGSKGDLRCVARVNGKGLQVRAIRPPKRPTQTHQRHTWTWFTFDVPGGQSNVEVTIQADKGGGSFQGEVGWWMWAKHPLVKYELTIEFKGPIRPERPERPEPLPLPLKMEYEDQVVTIRKAVILRAPRSWPNADKKTVWLDEVGPDQAAQGWGKLQRNKSVWEKPMIVAGRKFARGLGTHADGRLVYHLTGGKFQSFYCLVGRDQHANDGRIAFQVHVDGKKVFDSGPMTRASGAKPVAVDLTDAAVLELRTLDGGDGVGGDHGNWAEARLVR